MAVITNEGKAWDVLKLQSVAPASNALMQFITWGTGAQSEATVAAASPAFGQFTESAEARTTGTVSVPSSQTDRCVGTITATAARNITQVARTNVATVGGTGQTMLLYALFTSIPLSTADQITFTLDQLVA
jgi:hypothetical protein